MQGMIVAVSKATTQALEEIQRRLDGDEPRENQFDSAYVLLDSSGGAKEGLKKIGLPPEESERAGSVTVTLETEMVLPIRDPGRLNRLHAFFESWKNSATAIFYGQLTV